MTTNENIHYDRHTCPKKNMRGGMGGRGGGGWEGVGWVGGGEEGGEGEEGRRVDQ